MLLEMAAQAAGAEARIHKVSDAAGSPPCLPGALNGSIRMMRGHLLRRRSLKIDSLAVHLTTDQDAVAAVAASTEPSDARRAFPGQPLVVLRAQPV